MLTWLKAWTREGRTAKQLYGAVVTQARQPMFYTGVGVPDTPEGRYEMIVLHLFLLLERLRADGASTTGLSRRLIEAFVEDMDDSMREMGVGDLTVPKRVKRAAAGFYERAGEYRAGLEAPTAGVLETALAARLSPSDRQAPAVDLLAAYVRNAASELARQDTRELIEGRAAFPPVVYVEL